MKNYYLFLCVLFFLFLTDRTQAQTHFIEDVESQTDFAIRNFSGWSAFDFDKQASDGPWQDFPNKDSLFAFMVFTPSKTSPINTTEDWKPYSGEKMFVSFSKEKSNSWLLSPVLDLPLGGSYRFYAKAAAAFFGNQHFKVGYSTSTTDSVNFIFFDKEKVVEQDGEWKSYVYQLPAKTKYVAIVCISAETMMGGLCLDDLSLEATVSEKAPKAVASVSSTPDAKGNKKLSLSWMNPSQSVDNSALSNLNKIIILRGSNRLQMEVIKEITTASPGETMNFLDETIPQNGDYYYRIMAVNNEGTGKAYWSSRIFVGKENVVGAPLYIDLTPKETGNKLTWNKINYGAKGGILDGEVKGYTVLRILQSDTIVLGKFISDTFFQEKNLPNLNMYTYTIFGQRDENDKGIPLSLISYSGLKAKDDFIGSDIIGITSPIYFSYDSYLTQSIYPYQEFTEKGFITNLNWFAKMTKAVDTVPIKIYISTTKRNHFGLSSEGDDAKWIWFGNQHLVYEGIIGLKSGQNSFPIALHEAFYYNPEQQENLVVTVIRPKASFYSPQDYAGDFMGSKTDSLRTYSAKGYSSDISILTTQPPTWQSELSKTNPNIVYRTENQYCNLAFLVKANGEGQDSVKISVIPVDSSVTHTGSINYTDRQGNLDAVPVLAANYMILFHKEGLTPYKMDIHLDAKDTLIEVNLLDLSQISLSGRVLGPNAEPLAQIQVKASGYSNAQVLTDEDGRFSLVLFQKQNYQLSFSHPLYYAYDTSFVLPEESDLTIKDIHLSIFPHKAQNVVAKIENKDLLLSWNLPQANLGSKTLQIGSGIRATSWGAGGSEFIAAVKLDTQDLKTFKDAAYYITHIKSYIANFAQIDIQIYQSKAGETPTLLYSQFESISQEGWYNFELQKPILVDAEKDLYMAIRFPIGYGAYPIGVDDGPCIVGKGNVINEGAAWTSIGLTNKNWCIYGSIAELIPAQPTNYSIYRTLVSNKPEDTSWAKLADNINQINYSDPALANLDPGIYRYSVQAVYPKNISDKALSNTVRNKMDFTVHCKLENTKIKYREVFIALQNLEDQSVYYEKSVGSATNYKFPFIQRGKYKLNVWATPCEKYQIDEILIETDTVLNINIQEIIDMPKNLTATKKDGGIDLNWDLYSTHEEGFETYADFTITNFGDYYLYDEDKAPTVTYTNFKFPNAGKAMSYIIFNPFNAIPPIANAEPYEGRRFLGNVGEDGAVSDDWIVMPAREGEFSFEARSLVASPLESFKVLYSTGTMLVNSFRPIENTSHEPPLEWKNYSFTAPKETKYLAIRCVSSEGYILFIDKLKYQKPYKHAIGYDIYVDDEKVATDIKDLTYHIPQISKNARIIGVVAKFNSGESEMASIDMVSTEITQTADKTTVYPNPSEKGLFNVKLARGNHSMEVFHISGQMILKKENVTNQTQIDLSNYPSGIYMLELINGAQVERIKLIKK